jgi:DNA/RNA-binding domain of Phe-tRNA-synthetase-like protein
MDGAFPPPIEARLDGWTLAWLQLEPTGEEEAALAGLRTEEAAAARRRWSTGVPIEHPTVAALRRLFRAAGTDPTRYRPSSEALLRRILKGEELPAIHPLVDLNNLLSLRLLVPCCVIDPDRVAPPFTFRAGTAGEQMDSMRGPFPLEGKPHHADPQGPFGTPITDGERVKVRSGTGRVWLVAYLPAGVSGEGDPSAVMADLLARAPVARLLTP